MNLSEYKDLAARTAKVYHEPEVVSIPGMNIIHAGLGIAGESGELVDAIKKALIYGKELDIENIKEDIGDIFWYIALLANSLNLDLNEILDNNISKLQLRYPEKYSDQHASLRLDKQGE